MNEVEMRQKRAVEGEADAQKEVKEIMKKKTLNIKHIKWSCIVQTSFL